MKTFTTLNGTLGALLATVVLSGCMTSGGTKSESASAPAAAPAKAKIGPGMNERGEVTDPRKVEAGYGEKVKGLNDWQGEITGKPVPGSKMSQLKIGMTSSEVRSIMGEPSDQGAHITGKAFIPFYFGSDRYRYEVVYKGQGRLLFASSAGFGWNANTNLIWIIHSAAEPGTR
jgi:hypothetical protein